MNEKGRRERKEGESEGEGGGVKAGKWLGKGGKKKTNGKVENAEVYGKV